MPDESPFSILRIDSSARRRHSLTRRLGAEVIRRLLREHPGATVITRELAEPIELIDAQWIQASQTEPGQRTAGQRHVLATSDRLLQELDAADAVVLTAPVYNFSIPAALKAWIDMVCRAQLSFRYTENGPVGLLRDRPVYLVLASGGTELGGPADFASGYLRHIFGFIGIHDVRMVQAGRTAIDAQAGETTALNMLAEWLPATPAPA
jgi:FMN-dependent NADH-azoreductase